MDDPSYISPSLAFAFAVSYLPNLLLLLPLLLLILVVLLLDLLRPLLYGNLSVYGLVYVWFFLRSTLHPPLTHTSPSLSFLSPPFPSAVRYRCETTYYWQLTHENTGCTAPRVQKHL